MQNRTQSEFETKRGGGVGGTKAASGQLPGSSSSSGAPTSPTTTSQLARTSDPGGGAGGGAGGAGGAAEQPLAFPQALRHVIEMGDIADDFVHQVGRWWCVVLNW